MNLGYSLGGAFGGDSVWAAHRGSAKDLCVVLCRDSVGYPMVRRRLGLGST